MAVPIRDWKMAQASGRMAGMRFKPAFVRASIVVALAVSSVAVALAFALAPAGPSGGQQHDHGAAVRPAAAAQVKTLKPHQGPLPPLPYDGYPAPRPMPVVAAVYEFAARHPEVLQYMPCFCGCERHGHNGNHDCFVKSRDANGRVTWDSHGYGCAVCLDVGRDAMQMYNSGASVASIRAAIDKKYGASTMPTPKPPTKSATN